VGDDPKHTAVVWEWRSGQQLATVTAGGDKVYDMMFDPCVCLLSSLTFLTLFPVIMPSSLAPLTTVAQSLLPYCCLFLHR
jgi:hypothetical protein